jgi:hypothetical protein
MLAGTRFPWIRWIFSSVSPVSENFPPHLLGRGHRRAARYAFPNGSNVKVPCCCSRSCGWRASQDINRRRLARSQLAPTPGRMVLLEKEHDYFNGKNDALDNQADLFRTGWRFLHSDNFLVVCIPTRSRRTGNVRQCIASIFSCITLRVNYSGVVFRSLRSQR